MRPYHRFLDFRRRVRRFPPVLPIGVGYFLVLIIIDTFVLHPRAYRSMRSGASEKTRRALLEKIPFALLTAGFRGLTLFGRFFAHRNVDSGQGIEQFGWVSRVMQAFYIWAYYAWNSGCPSTLGQRYGTLIWFNPFSPPFLLSAAIVVGTTVILFHEHRRWPAAPGALALPSHPAAPALGLTEHPHYPSDRYGFIPNVIWAIFLAGGTLWLFRKWSRGGFIAGTAVCLLLFFGTLSFSQGYSGGNTVTLLEQTLRIYGNKSSCQQSSPPPGQRLSRRARLCQSG